MLSWCTFLAIPKSVTLHFSPSPTRTFLAAKSRWIIWKQKWEAAFASTAVCGSEFLIHDSPAMIRRPSEKVNEIPSDKLLNSQVSIIILEHEHANQGRRIIAGGLSLFALGQEASKKIWAFNEFMEQMLTSRYRNNHKEQENLPILLTALWVSENHNRRIIAGESCLIYTCTRVCTQQWNWLLKKMSNNGMLSKHGWRSGWEHSPPTNVARVPVDSRTHKYMSWVCCWLSSLLWDDFYSRYSGCPLF